jgi:hypothetical protein
MAVPSRTFRTPMVVGEICQYLQDYKDAILAILLHLKQLLLLDRLARGICIAANVYTRRTSIKKLISKYFRVG